MATLSAAQTATLVSRLSKIKHVILVLSGKGGVGKSSVSVSLALTLQSLHPAANVGLLDIDLTGPSIPRMLGLQDQDVHQSAEGWVPVHLGKLKCMSIAFLLKDQSQAVVWRGPKKSAMVRQFLGDVRWGELDYLIIDTPPGTSDEHISLLENLQMVINPTDGTKTLSTKLSSILVTTPQAVSLSDVSKELSFARKTSLQVIGLIENMSGYICPHCDEVTPVFGIGGGEQFCKMEEEAKVSGQGEGCAFLGRLPIDSELIKLFDGATKGGAAETSLIERFAQLPTYKLVKPIVEDVVRRIEEI